NTGKYLWHFQVTHHDIWDMDTQSAPMLVDVKKDGRTIPAVITVNKNALMFILNRVTGKPIYGVEERPVPQSEVPGEKTSPTQPFPVNPEPLGRETVSMNDIANVDPDHRAACLDLIAKNNVAVVGPYIPPRFNLS